MFSLNFVSNIGKNIVNTIVNLYFEIFIYVTLKRLVKLGKFVLSLILLHLIATFYVQSSRPIGKFFKASFFKCKIWYRKYCIYIQNDEIICVFCKNMRSMTANCTKFAEIRDLFRDTTVTSWKSVLHFFFFFRCGNICLHFLAKVSRPRIMISLLARSSHPEPLYFHNVASFRRNRNYSPRRWEECRKKNHFERNRNWNFQTWSFPAAGRKLHISSRIQVFFPLQISLTQINTLLNVE